eukprot:COSAG04_NODE_8589_length_953_cov_1.937939_1_plen_70_part_01
MLRSFSLCSQTAGAFAALPYSGSLQGWRWARHAHQVVACPPYSPLLAPQVVSEAWGGESPQGVPPGDRCL